MAEENLNHNENDSAKSSAVHPVGEDNIKPEPCEENLNVTGNDIIKNKRPEAGDEEKEKEENKEHLDLDIEPCKVEEKKSPDQNDPVSLPNSSASDGETTAIFSPSLDRTRRPEDALNEIKKQATHNLYCCKCKSNITTDVKLFKKGDETDEYKTKPYVIWIPLLIPSFLLQLFPRNPPDPVTISPGPVTISPGPLTISPNSVTISPGPVTIYPNPVNPIPPKGLWEKLKNIFLNWLTFLRFLLVVVLLLISVIVLLVLRKNDDKDLSLPTLMYIKYLPVIASLFLAILAVPWRSIPVPYPDILRKYIMVPIQNLDIVKSIVYGGLIESITSLGVVSCAAGSGTSTLNVLALGIANLITGLILIIHKLYGLITNQPRSHSANNDHHVTDSQREALYKEMLGKTEKVKLHCLVVVVSFIFFGMIPPFFYGLSFKRKDEGLYKAAFVLSASLGCVIILSFAKANAFGMKKRWTVPVYTCMAVVASVLSFIASQFLSGLLEKYDFHELAPDYKR